MESFFLIISLCEILKLYLNSRDCVFSMLLMLVIFHKICKHVIGSKCRIETVIYHHHTVTIITIVQYNSINKSCTIDYKCHCCQYHIMTRVHGQLEHGHIITLHQILCCVTVHPLTSLLCLSHTSMRNSLSVNTYYQQMSQAMKYDRSEIWQALR